MRTVMIFVLSLAVYHWSLDELELFSPEAAGYTRNITEKIRIEVAPSSVEI